MSEPTKQNREVARKIQDEYFEDNYCRPVLDDLIAQALQDRQDRDAEIVEKHDSLGHHFANAIRDDGSE